MSLIPELKNKEEIESQRPALHGKKYKITYERGNMSCNISNEENNVYKDFVFFDNRSKKITEFLNSEEFELFNKIEIILERQ